MVKSRQVNNRYRCHFPRRMLKTGNGCESRTEPPLYLESRSHFVTGLMTGKTAEAMTHKPEDLPVSFPVSPPRTLERRCVFIGVQRKRTAAACLRRQFFLCPPPWAAIKIITGEALDEDQDLVFGRGNGRSPTPGRHDSKDVPADRQGEGDKETRGQIHPHLPAGRQALNHPPQGDNRISSSTAFFKVSLLAWETVFSL